MIYSDRKDEILVMKSKGQDVFFPKAVAVVYFIAIAHDGSPYIQVLKWSGKNLVKMADYPAFGTKGRDVKWSPDGKYLAATGYTAEAQDQLIVLGWANETLSLVDTYNFGARGNQLSWHPNGDILAVGKNTGGAAYTLGLFSFDGSSLDLLYSLSLGSGAGISWSPDGSWLAFGNASPYGTELYEWTGSELILRDSHSYD